MSQNLGKNKVNIAEAFNLASFNMAMPLLPKNKQESQNLSSFTPEDQEKILQRREVLSINANMIGNDYKMPILIGEVGSGWHWNYKYNYISVDPKDLLEKPIEVSRFIMFHEGAHRLLSKISAIDPQSLCDNKEFMNLLNSIEDPRVNNYASDTMSIDDGIYQDYQVVFENSQKDRSEFLKQYGFIPHSEDAGLAILGNWFNDWCSHRNGGDRETITIDPPPSKEVGQFIIATKDSYRRAYNLYPLLAEVEQGEEIIKAYAKASFDIVIKDVWPEYCKLLKKDEETAKAAKIYNDYIKDITGEGENSKTSEEIKEKIKELIIGKGEKPDGSAKNYEELPQEIKDKLKEIVDQLPDDMKAELAEAAKKALEEYRDKFKETIDGKISKDVVEKDKAEDKKEDKQDKDLKEELPRYIPPETQDIKEFNDQIEKIINKNCGVYENTRSNVMSIINKLTMELKKIFIERRTAKVERGYRSGTTINIDKRISEIAAGISTLDTTCFERRAKPQEKDYAISILVDLSGSMEGEKIKESFKSVIVLAETLKNIGIKFEILGFNDRLYEYKKFSDKLSKDERDKIGEMLKEVESERARYNDDGWALIKASERLSQEKADNKYLFIISDGMPEPSSAHSSGKYELSNIVKQVLNKGDQHLIALGLGRSTDHVKSYYPNSIANISAHDLPITLAGLIRSVIGSTK